MTVTNADGTYSFETHKLILSAISPVFRDQLEGNQELKKILIPVVRKEALQNLEKIIFMSEQDRNSFDFLLMQELDLTELDPRIMQDLLLLHAKYDIKILEQVVLTLAANMVRQFLLKIDIFTTFRSQNCSLSLCLAKILMSKVYR